MKHASRYVMASSSDSPRVRRPAVAGMFYRDDAARLRREVRGFIDAGRTSNLVPKAIIVPHAGYVYSGQVAGSGYRALANLETRVRRVFLLGPAHRVYTRGVAAPAHQSFSSPLGEMPIDRERITELCERFDFVTISDASHAEEHSLEVHLPFLQTALGDFLLVPLVVGEVHPGRLRELIDHVLDNPGDLLVVSSDLSHYHGYDEARLIDAQTVELMENLEWQEMRPERACGFVPVSALLLSAAERGWRVSAVDVRNSGDTAGPRDRVVGYASLVVHEPVAEFDPETRKRLLGVARDSIEHGFSDLALAIDPTAWPRACGRHTATFVTLESSGVLRGCIGSLAAEEPLVASVANNAARAAFNDPRFPPLTRREFDEIDICISVLSPPVPMRFDSQEALLEQLRPGEDGLILSWGRHRGTFLPSVWRLTDSPGRFLAHLKRKAGLSEDFWSDDIRIERYTTESFGE
ncbi:MAG: AmmeMemoRadiSam system protein B [Proteobacteria bacterium]|nr:MAG: AmmeMemoRadiSam system protein B [Pseudomonadota bacterium]